MAHLSMQLILEREPRNPQGLNLVDRSRLNGSSSVVLAVCNRVHTYFVASLLCGAWLLLSAGCGSNGSDGDSASEESSQTESQPRSGPGASSGIQSRELGGTSRPGSQDANSRGDSDEITSNELFSTESTSYQDAQKNNRNLGQLINEGERIENLGPPPVDEERVNALGIRKYEGEFIDLYTDVRDPVVAEYVDAFDQAVPQWAEYFHIEVPSSEDFHIRASLMQEKQRFYQAGLLHEDLPQFLYGYQRGSEFWVIPQPGPYFSRHLVLHEGTHAFMTLLLGGAGPPWYMEGMAELLGTHYWRDGKLALKSRIEDKEDAPYWGRVKIVRDGFTSNEALELEQILRYGWTAHLETEPYGWCWAACAFFDGHPEYQEKFRDLRKNVADRSITFSDQFVESFGDDWNRVREEWQLYVSEMDYGYDVARAAVVYKEPQALTFSGATMDIDVARGWQSTGVSVSKGKSYRISAEGRFRVAQDGQTWWCEPEGVTIHYYRGLPLGRLLGAVRSNDGEDASLTSLAQPISIGQEFVLTPEVDGVLFLRINESPKSLADNAGLISVDLREQ